MRKVMREQDWIGVNTVILGKFGIEALIVGAKVVTGIRSYTRNKPYM
jgi:hypothetical protein